MDQGPRLGQGFRANNSLANFWTAAENLSWQPRLRVRSWCPAALVDKSYMKRIAPEIYGGALRENPELIGMHAENIEEPPIWAISTNYWL
jgi:hypothetical protein